MSKTSKAMRPRVEIPSVAEDVLLTAQALTDPDALPWSAEQLATVTVTRSPRGRPKSANSKRLVSIRYSPEVLEYFQSTGPGWQVRMDEALQAYVQQQKTPR